MFLQNDVKFMEKLKSSKSAQGRLCCVVCICFLFMIIEVIGGYISNSIAIMTDAAHMFSDVAGFGISIIAIRYGLRQPNAAHSYGYHRSEVLGALTSVVIIWVLVGWLVIEAIARALIIINGGSLNIKPEIMVATACFGLCCNIVNMIALGECPCNEDKEDDGFTGNQGDGDLIKNSDLAASSIVEEDKDASKNMNLRAAMIHMLGDLIQSIGVILAGLVILYFPEYEILDPCLTVMFCIIVFMTTVGITKDCYAILMEMTPEDIDCERIKEKILSIPEVDYIDDFHCWALAGGKNMLSMHIYLKRGDDEMSLPSSDDIHKVYQKANHIVKKYHVLHSTLQVL